MKFLVYRYNPETDTSPYMQAFDIEVTRGMAHTPCQCAVAVRVGPGQ